MHTIYALIDPRNNEVRYVGVTRNPEQRRQAHKYSKADGGMAEWASDLMASNVEPKMKILEQTEAGGIIAHEIEKEWIIYYSAAVGANLLNKRMIIPSKFGASRVIDWSGKTIKITPRIKKSRLVERRNALNATIARTEAALSKLKSKLNELDEQIEEMG